MGWLDRMRKMDPPAEPEPDWRSIAADAIEAQAEERRAFGVLHREIAAVSAGLATGLDPEGARMMLEGAFDRAAAARSADAECRDPVPERPPAGDPGWVGLDELRDRVCRGLENAGTPDVDGVAELVLRAVFAPLGLHEVGVNALIEANPRIEVDGPDLVSRMIDARDCLRNTPGYPDPLLPATTAAISGALRWLDEGIEEGKAWRAAMASLHATLGDEAEPHVCTCAHSPERGLVGCSDGFGDRCRFELAIRKAVRA